MNITAHDWWTVVHGMGFGAIYLLAFGGAITEIYAMKSENEIVGSVGSPERLKRLKLGLWTMTVVSWLTVIIGTWLVYVWYRTKPVSGVDLSQFPRYFLLSNDSTKLWHSFGMEWKEHVAWIAPMLTTAVAYSCQMVGERLSQNRTLRYALIALLVLAFFTSAVAGVFGAFINKYAPTR